MSPELEQTLYASYPRIFEECTLRAEESSMYWGVQCGDGWFSLLDVLCATLQWETDENDAPQIVARQVKEKLGGLRFRVHTASDRQRGMIRMAENMAESTCDISGAPRPVVATSRTG